MIAAMESVYCAPKLGDVESAKPMKVRISRQSYQRKSEDSQGGEEGRHRSKYGEPKAKDRRQPKENDGATLQRDMLAQQNAMLMQQMAHLNQAFWCSQMQTSALVAKDVAQTSSYAMYMQTPPAPQSQMEMESEQRRATSQGKKNLREPRQFCLQGSTPMSAQGSLPMSPQASIMEQQPSITQQWSDVSTAAHSNFSSQSSDASQQSGSIPKGRHKTKEFGHEHSNKSVSEHPYSKNQQVSTEGKPQPQTTVMIRNLIETCTRQMLLDFLIQKGFKKQFDMVYLPLSFSSNLCFHYAFVNFVTEEATNKFMKELQGYKGAEVFGEQPCDISMVMDNQGLEAAIKRYRNSPVMHPSVPDECKPIIFKDGRPIPFPPPTKNIRKPRKDM